MLDRALSSSEIDDRLVLDSLGDEAVIVTDTEGCITRWNAGAVALFGWSAQDILGRSIACIFTPDDRSSRMPEAERAQALAQGRSADERWHLRRDGSRLWAYGRMAPLRDAGGQVVGFVKAMVDRTEELNRIAEHARLEAAYREADERLRLALESGVLLGTWVWQLAEGRVFPDAQLGKTLALGPDARQGLPEADLLQHIHGLDRANVTAALHRSAEQHLPFRVVFRLPLPHGLIWAEATGRVEYAADGTPRRCPAVLVDITARRRAERAVRDGEDRLRLATEAARLGTFDCDPKTGALTWDARCRELFGGLQDTQLDFARDFIGGMHPEDRAAAEQAVRRALDPEGDGLLVHDYRTIGPQNGGVTHWLAARGRCLFEAGEPVRLIGTVLDITEARRDQEVLQHHNDLLEERVAERTRERDRMWRLSHELMLIADMEGRFVAVNPAWMTILGWSEADLIGQQMHEVVHPDDLEEAIRELESLRHGNTVMRFESRHRHRDGDYRWVSWAAVPEGDRIYAVGRDITEAKLASDALREAEEALRQSQKMDAVGQLTGGIAHDFNNLLTGIIGAIELMQNRINGGRLTDLDRYARMAMDSARRGAALTHRLLAFARRQSLSPQPTDLNQTARHMDELISRTVGPEIRVEVVTNPGLWPTLCDPNQVENALLNLVINARDAMPDGGVLTIETHNAELDRHYARQNRDVTPGEYVVLCVSDTGCGMTPDVLQRAFDPFFTTKPIGKGTGLGLSMIYGFSKQSGGHVRIYSAPGQGTTVRLYLPRYRGVGAEAPQRGELAAVPEAVKGCRILLVDDEAMLRTLAAEVLTGFGYEVTEAGDAEAALAVLRQPGQVDLLVTDVGLPGGMNGRQMAELAERLRPGLPVLFITGYGEAAMLEDGILPPGTQVMAKPFAMDALASRISAMTRKPGAEAPSGMPAP